MWTPGCAPPSSATGEEAETGCGKPSKTNDGRETTRDGPRTHLEGVAAAAAAEHDGRPAGDLAEDVVVIRGRGVEAALCHKGLGLNVRERRTDLSGRRRDVKKKRGKEE